MSGPLEGVRVLDLSRLLPGGFCSLLLADFGAEVLKVEDTGMGDYVRWSPPYHEGAEETARSALFLALNRGKRSIRVNLKEEGGREVLLRLVREYDVLLESFRPGVHGAAGRRLRAPARGEPAARLLRDHRLRPGRPVHATRSGHDMNYLGLGRAARPDRRRRRAARAGRRPDRRHRRRRADGGVRDPRRAARARAQRRGPARRRLDVRRRAVLARRWSPRATSATGSCRRAARRELSGGLVCYRPYACKDGWVTLGALEPKFWQAWCRGVGREDLIEKQFERPAPTRTRRSSASSSSARAPSGRRSPRSTTAASSPCSGSTRRSTRSSCARARWSSRSTSRARTASSCWASRSSCSRTPGGPAGPGPELGEHTRGGARRARLRRRGGRRARGVRCGCRARRAGRAGASCRERERPAQDEGAGRGERRQRRHDQALPPRGPAGRGPDIVKTSRNMAWYPPEFVERIKLIKQLQEERFMPLKVIKSMLDEDPERTRALVELEDRILERAPGGRAGTRVGRRAEAPLRHPPDGARPARRARACSRPTRAATAPSDVEIVEAISRFRAGGYDERIGFTVYDTLRYKRALEQLVKEEVAGAARPAGGRARSRQRRRPDRPRRSSRSAS